MIDTRTFSKVLVPLAALLLLAGTPVSAQLISGANAFPTGDEGDGKFVALAGTEFATLTQGSLSFSVQVPLTAPGSNHECVSDDLRGPGNTGPGRCLFLGIFDGETSGESFAVSAPGDPLTPDERLEAASFSPAGPYQHWDNLSTGNYSGDDGTQLGIALFRDPNQVASTAAVDFLGYWEGNGLANMSKGRDGSVGGDPDWVTFGGGNFKDFSDSTLPGPLTSFVDNGWWNLELEVNACEPGSAGCAQAVTGVQSYHLCLFYNPEPGLDPYTDAADIAKLCPSGDTEQPDAEPDTVSVFKVQAEAEIVLLSDSFAFEGSQHNLADIAALFPEWPPVSGGPDFFVPGAETTYDGNWEFLIAVPADVPVRSLELFDGDFDYGTRILDSAPAGFVLVECNDDDDRDSPMHPDFAGELTAPGPAFCPGVDPYDPPHAMSMLLDDYAIPPPGDGLCAADGSVSQTAKTAGTPADDNFIDLFRRFGDESLAGGVPGPPDWPAEVPSDCVVYRLISPGADGDIETAADNEVYYNPNPSSQREWEQFRVLSRCECDAVVAGECTGDDPAVRECGCTDPDDPIAGLPVCAAELPKKLAEVFDPFLDDDDAQADYVVDHDMLPAGLWKVEIFGVDMSNLNAWTGPQFCPAGGCSLGLNPPYKVGDTVWKDTDGDGAQDPDESGIPLVKVNLLDELGEVVTMRLTGEEGQNENESCEECNTGGDPSGPADPDPKEPVDEDGLFCFDVNVPPIPGVPPAQNCRQFVVEVDPTNFDENGPLDGLVATTDSPQQECELCETNGGAVTLNCDFGFAAECLDDIFFEVDGDGGPLATGQIVDDEFAALGISVTTNDPVNHPAMIFDSANPTGGDDDLGAPNETFGGPGVGSGGEAGQPGANALARGKVLILSEDGDSGDPDDNAGGGTLIFTFAYGVRVDAVQILDIDEGMGGTVTAFDAGGGVIGAAAMSGSLGNNSFQTVAVGAAGVRRLEVFFPGSGAVAGILFCIEEVPCEETIVRDDFDVQSFGNNDGPDSWAANWVENDVAGAGPGSGNVKITSSALRLDDYPNTGTHPSAARQVDLSGSLFATLKFMFDTSSGVDSSDAVAVEASADGGASWTVLETITGIVGAHWGMREIDISAFISPQTAVRFRVSNKYGGSHEYFYVTHVEICGVCEAPPCLPVKVKDRFDSETFSGNDGPDDWSGPWDEFDTAGPGPTSGNVKVWGGYLKLNDYPNTNTQPSAARTVDLSGTSHATLEFDWRTWSGVDLSDAVVVEISSDGGDNYTVLDTFTNIHGAQTGWESYDITPYISSETTVRFRVTRYYGASNEWFKVDALTIEGTCD